MMILLEANFDAILYLVLAIMFGPAILLAIIGFILLKNNKKTAKVFFILGALYVVISLGVCGSMMM